MEAFGTDTALFFLRTCFRSFTVMWAPSRETNDRLLNDLARIVLSDGMQLNTGEICLFVSWLKAGKMGNLYDASPVRISTAFQVFLEKRRQTRLQMIDEQREREEKALREEQRRQMDSPEYCLEMIEYFDNKGDKALAQAYRARLAALKGGDR